MGIGDIYCVYRFALYELIWATKEVGSEDAVETLSVIAHDVTSATKLIENHIGMRYIASQK